MKIKEKLIRAKDRVEDFMDDHIVGLTIGGYAALVGGLALYLYGYANGIKNGRKEWDFSDEIYTGKTSMFMDSSGEYIGIVPNSIMKEIFDAHKKSLGE